MIMDRPPDHFLLMNGDVLTDLDYADLLDSHVASGAPLPVATNERVYQVAFGVLNVGADRQITAFTEKPPLSYTVSMGVYAISKSHLERYTPGLPYGFDEIVCDLIERETYPASCEFNGFWLDIGRPEDYDRANEEFAIFAPRLLPGVR
jgi:mannose-1-phosphate guanylyltransferase